MYGSVRSRRRTRVRLTRRGRIVVVAAAFLLAGVLVLVAGPVVAAAAATDQGGVPPAESAPGVVAVVQPGDTLWSVAARHVPSHDAPGAVAEIRRLNDLSGITIHPGQRLRMPAR